MLINVPIRNAARPRNGEAQSPHALRPICPGRGPGVVPAGPILRQEGDRRNRRCTCERVAQRGDGNSITRFAALVRRALGTATPSPSDRSIPAALHTPPEPATRHVTSRRTRARQDRPGPGSTRMMGIGPNPPMLVLHAPRGQTQTASRPRAAARAGWPCTGQTGPQDVESSSRPKPSWAASATLAVSA